MSLNSRKPLNNNDPMIGSSSSQNGSSFNYGSTNLNGVSFQNQIVSLPRIESGNNLVRQRSMSFSGTSVTSSNNNLPDETGLAMSHQEITAPGGFRRSFILRKHTMENKKAPYLPDFIVTNFKEFLTLYGHFAGEDLSETDEEEEAIEEEEEEVQTSLLRRRPIPDTTRTQAAPVDKSKKVSTTKAILLLLKSFVGTGILFLPKGFSNGGYSFSTISLLLCSVISYYCFVLLISTKDTTHGINGYGDLGQHLFGRPMKFAILLSIVLSQIGFSAAYTVFVATNLKTLCNSVFENLDSSIKFFIIFQAILFIPLSFTRNITKLTATALIADFFILIGLLYIYYYPISYISYNGIARGTMVPFNNKSWSLFIGTAIFTFEGIGLLIPIQESMAKPHLFRLSLSLVMVIVTLIFVSVGLLCYSAFGSDVETVVLLNFPQDSPYTLIVQLLYSLAILLSTPLQLFPAIRILENWVFKSRYSGKYNPKIKWAKNYFRTLVVIGTSFIAWIGADDLDKFVSLVGSFACIPLIYIYPPLLHIKALKRNGTVTNLHLIVDSCMIIFGFTILIYTSCQTIKLWIT
ncbi:hypothetical protein Kpol_1032p88 [Vanderwaltozyma polyspora DSM 70294]|uniref:Amino acid transporter transmembrane domain-containing protein n=1 Tax=Vanderwaltozyma polyspora (strain ATCC 22028 / DSM 70294 / BCRC 21397 / CBS 2163 / NBRC 10782 / NRRL Y-8283 / UCD 57-17) TaxID=436907 RepID=A7TH39_VANPO|nr:uncharacterized protein Kpol_1032p88 [Vanderwaltozyma polyspora DSM 70294]EDO18491.1 hypothetical protein Kpol_1032p88 [Vanderwaltozyma polyspora DSM 70294]